MTSPFSAVRIAEATGDSEVFADDDNVDNDIEVQRRAKVSIPPAAATSTFRRPPFDSRPPVTTTTKTPPVAAAAAVAASLLPQGGGGGDTATTRSELFVDDDVVDDIEVQRRAKVAIPPAAATSTIRRSPFDSRPAPVTTTKTPPPAAVAGAGAAASLPQGGGGGGVLGTAPTTRFAVPRTDPTVSKSITGGRAGYHRDMKRMVWNRVVRRYGAMKLLGVLLAIYTAILSFTYRGTFGQYGGSVDRATGYVIDVNSAENTAAGLIRNSAGIKRAVVATTVFEMVMFGIARLTALYMYPGT
jgi:hypothetical protein